eukprot:gene2694-25465_t
MLLLLSFCSIAVSGHPRPPPQPAPVLFNQSFGSYMVLQQAPAKSAVYGTIPFNDTAKGAKVTIKVTGDASYTPDVVLDSATGNWKAFLTPTKAGGDFTITATCTGCVNTTDAVLEHVTFGDVWYCAGQSNMWLPLSYTYHRNETVGNITEGKLDNIRLMAGNSQSGTFHPWQTSKQSISNSNETEGKYNLFQFSAACWYFAESLTYRLQAEVDAGRAEPSSIVPLGLISTAIGGSMIEEWTTNATTAACTETNAGSHNQMLWDQKVVPYLNMTMKGFVWYQGENNMHSAHGNFIEKTGYGCQMPAMINLWREAWSTVPGTTNPNAPFGLVVLPGSGSEGGANMAQAYDLNDPWGAKDCYEMSCCWNNYNESKCTSSLVKRNFKPTDCNHYCSILQGTQVFMGGIHPRIKKPVGYRLAAAAIVEVYNHSGAYTGPTISGCSTSGKSLVVKMNSTLLAGGSVYVQPYNKTQSPLQVLTNASLFCAEPMMRCAPLPNGTRPASHCQKDPTRPAWNPFEAYCPPGDGSSTAGQTQLEDAPGFTMSAAQFYADDKLGGHGPPNPFDSAWTSVPVEAGDDQASVKIDLAGVNGTVVGIRYAWGTGGNCCMGDANGITIPCYVETCPIMSKPSGLPANPFMARVTTSGKCACIPPQKCDA